MVAFGLFSSRRQLRLDQRQQRGVRALAPRLPGRPVGPARGPIKDDLDPAAYAVGRLSLVEPDRLQDVANVVGVDRGKRLSPITG
jgi:hypothetical protein